MNLGGVDMIPYHHSNCSSPEPKRCDCLLNDDEEGRILIPCCTF